MTFVEEKKKRKRGKKTYPLTPEQRSDRNQRKRMKERAAVLSIESLGGGLFRVWGGDDPHIVAVMDGMITCDCLGWLKARNHNCSHVMKYRLVYGDLKK